MASAMSLRVFGAAALVGLAAAETASGSSGEDECYTLFMSVAEDCEDLASVCATDKCMEAINDAPNKCNSWDCYDIDGEWKCPLEEAMHAKRICDSECLLKFIGVEDACSGCTAESDACKAYLDGAAAACTNGEWYWVEGTWRNISVAEAIANMTESLDIMCSKCGIAAMVSENAGCTDDANILDMCTEGSPCNAHMTDAKAKCQNSSFYDFDELRVIGGAEIEDMFEILDLMCQPCYMAFMEFGMANCTGGEMTPDMLTNMCSPDSHCGGLISDMNEHCTEDMELPGDNGETINLADAAEGIAMICSPCYVSLMNMSMSCPGAAMCEGPETYCGGLKIDMAELCTDDMMLGGVNLGDMVDMIGFMCSGSMCNKTISIERSLVMKYNARPCGLPMMPMM